MRKIKSAILVACLPIAATAGVLFKVHAGKSIRFFLDSKFRAPLSVHVIESGNRCVGRDGECIYIFEADAKTITGYLSKTPWKGCQWMKGPIPDNAFGFSTEIRPYLRYMSTDDVWYMAQDFGPKTDEGHIMIIDVPQKRVYFTYWWY